MLQDAPPRFWTHQIPSLYRELRRDRHGGECAEERSDDGDPGVGPVAVALVGDRQQGVGDARAEVAGRVDRVARGAAERQADREDQQADGERTECAESDLGCGAAAGGERLRRGRSMARRPTAPRARARPCRSLRTPGSRSAGGWPATVQNVASLASGSAVTS